MSQYITHDPEDKLECPYCHSKEKIYAKRFQYHLMKCKKNYVGPAFEKCPFNATHHIPKSELRHHLNTCPDKAIIEPEISYKSRKENENATVILKGCTDTPVYRDIEIPAEEDWDAEASDAPVIVETAFANPYFDRVRFTDISREELGGGNNMGSGENLRLPNTQSHAAMAVPKPQPIKQPAHHSVYTFSIGRGRGRNRGQNGEAAHNGAREAFTPVMPIGRGIAPGIGRGRIVPAPRFCVPNVNSQSWAD